VFQQWNQWKSDRYGRRAFGKYVDIPMILWPAMMTPIVPYREALQCLKRIQPDLSVHSVRRGAATVLANNGYSMEEIGMLTGHTPTREAGVNVRRYVDPSLAQPEALTQRAMSRLLWQCVWATIRWT
jgi:integrase